MSRRMLLVHAHPDDETIGTGATMARYAAEGAAVTLVTCTLGEMGEILVPALDGIAADRGDQLGGYRIAELRDAVGALGVTDHRFLGGAGRWRDSGMINTAANQDPRAFWRCDSDPDAFAEAVGQLVAVIRETRPQVLITYDPNGGYGHPDHIMAHRVAMAAAREAARESARESALGRGEDETEPWSIAKIYWTAGADDEITTAIEAEPWLEAKKRAMRAHATQIVLDGRFFALSNLISQVVQGTEYYRLVGASASRDGLERDLFAGVAS
jgi:N-acetyl-1-D-myo-inositol-2-amino-2-deoxy-alpha-D-glucopyranoside deacetylase